MSRTEIGRRAMQSYLQAHGWDGPCRWGHYRKSAKDGTLYRAKFQAHTVRFEMQVNHEAGEYWSASKSWVRFKGARFSQIDPANVPGAITRSYV